MNNTINTRVLGALGHKLARVKISVSGLKGITACFCFSKLRASSAAMSDRTRTLNAPEFKV